MDIEEAAIVYIILSLKDGMGFGDSEEYNFYIGDSTYTFFVYQ